MNKKYQLVVIGAGPGGYIAAIRAAQLGIKTAIIEADKLGGVCLNWGCIPTKTLLRSAEVVRLLHEAEDFGLKNVKADIDIKAMVTRSRHVAGQLEKGVAGLMKKNKIDVLEGRGFIADATHIEVRNGDKMQLLETDFIIIASGARPRVPKGVPSDSPCVWTAREAMTPDTIPKSLLVVGSGAIGVEFASFYQDIGSRVTLIEAAAHILPREDVDISIAAAEALSGRGVEIKTECRFENVKAATKSVSVSLADGEGKQDRRFDAVLLAMGVEANVENLWYDALSIECAEGHIVTDAGCRTSTGNIFAIGDVAGGPWLAHKASHEGVIAAEIIAGKAPVPLNQRLIPACTYAHPQIASIGITEAEAKQSGRAVHVGKAPFAANGKALAQGDAYGFVKTIIDAESGELLGAHLIGHEVTEQIHIFAAAMAGEATDSELAHMIFAHPSMAESLHESVLDARGENLNL